MSHPDLWQSSSAQYHYNNPIYIQYFYYFENVFHGNLGYATSRGFLPVVQVIAGTLPFSLQIAFFAFLIAMGLGIPLGVLAARYSHKPIDHGIRAFYLAGVSSPAFFVALLLLIVFTDFFRILPAGGAVATGIAPPTSITGIPMLDAALELNWTYLSSSLYHVILPAAALAVGAFGIVVRILRASTLQVLQSNYIRTARAKGVGEDTVFFNACIEERVDTSLDSFISDIIRASLRNAFCREHLRVSRIGPVRCGRNSLLRIMRAYSQLR